MHTHATTQASLAADIIAHITGLDEMLKLADADDQAELAERIAALDPVEFKHILATFGVKPTPAATADAPAVEEKVSL
jgi:hypothetical protein